MRGFNELVCSLFSWIPTCLSTYSVNLVETNRKIAMTTEKRKPELIKGAVKIEKSSSLEKLEDPFIQAEMEARTKESLEAIRNGEVLTLDEFIKSNKEWLKKTVTK